MTMQQRPLLDLLGARWAAGAPVVAAVWSADGTVAGFAMDDGTLALAARTWPGAARVAQRPSGGIELVPATAPPPPVVRVNAHRGGCGAIVASPAGGFVTLGTDGTLARTANDGATLPPGEDVPDALTVPGLRAECADVVATWTEQDGLRVRLSPGAAWVTLAGGPDSPTALSVFDEGRMLAVAGGARPLCWRLLPGPGEPFAGGIAGRHPVSAVAGHPHRVLLAAGYAHGVVLLCQPTGEEVLFLRAPDGAAVTALAWSGDGRRLALGTQGGEVAVLALPAALFRQQEAA
jgi:hypothetical protein